MKKRRLGFKVLLFVILALLLYSLSQLANPSTSPSTVAKEPQNDDLCMSCHAKNTYAKSMNPNLINQSAHKSLMCTDCHLAVHQKTVNLKLDLNKQCLSCHAAKNQDNNIHSAALKGGAGALCTDCHGIHDIKAVTDPESTVYRLNVHNTCLKCHSNMLETYQYGFHGTAVDLGSMKAATCIDCHGSHSILPPTNPNSSVAKTNIPNTCAKCHTTAQVNFAQGTQHLTPYDKEKDGAFPLWIILKFFLALILFDILKDCTIAIFELIQKIRHRKEKNKDNRNTWDI